MIRKHLPLFLTIFALLLLPYLSPKLHLTCLAPLLTLTALTAKTPKVYRYALLGGLCLDLMSSEHRMGFFTISSLFATWVIHSQRHNFFADKLWGLTLYASLFSLAKTLFEMIALTVFSTLPPLSWKGICSECIIMSAVDGLFALLLLTCPLYLFDLASKSYLRWKHH